MSAVILYASIGHDSVGEVQKAMLQEVQVVRSRQGRLDPDVSSCDILIRFGCTSKLQAGVVYNTAPAIRAASNKAMARERLHEAGVPVPTPGSDVFPCIARPHKHSGGREIWICHTPEDVQAVMSREKPVYFSAFYPKQREYRVHVAHGKVLILNEKVPRDGQEHLKNKVVWNHALNDFVFRVVRWGGWPLHVVELAIRTLRVMELDFGAVDILADPADDDLPPAVVCEVNTGMSIDSPYTTLRYAQYFDWLIRQGSASKRAHYNITSPNPWDYAWVFKTRSR